MQLDDKRILVPPICFPRIQILKNRTAYIGIMGGETIETLVDLISLRSFGCSYRFELSASVYKFGNISVLRVRNEFFTRTRKSYAVVFPISKDDISYHGFYLLIHDPMAKRGMPVCVIEGDEEQYYWLVETLADGSIRVMTEDEKYYHVTQDGKRKGDCKSPLTGKVGDCKSPPTERRVKNINADASQKKKAPNVSRKVEPVKMGVKWGMKVDGRLFVPPIYLSIYALNDEYFAIEKWPGQWGISNMAGKVVVEPKYAKVEILADDTVVATTVAGKRETFRLG